MLATKKSIPPTNIAVPIQKAIADVRRILSPLGRRVARQ